MSIEHNYIDCTTRSVRTGKETSKSTKTIMSVILHITDQYMCRYTQHYNLGSSNCAKAYSSHTKVFNMTAQI